jgi:hypothetical protein
MPKIKMGGGKKQKSLLKKRMHGALKKLYRRGR